MDILVERLEIRNFLRLISYLRWREKYISNIICILVVLLEINLKVI